MREEDTEILHCITRIIFANTDDLSRSIEVELDKIVDNTVSPGLSNLLSKNKLFMDFLTQTITGKQQQTKESSTFRFYQVCYDLFQNLILEHHSELNKIVEIVIAYVKEELDYLSAHSQILEITHNERYFKLCNKAFCTRPFKQRAVNLKKKSMNSGLVDAAEKLETTNTKRNEQEKGRGSPAESSKRNYIKTRSSSKEEEMDPTFDGEKRSTSSKTRKSYKDDDDDDLDTVIFKKPKVSKEAENKQVKEEVQFERIPEPLLPIFPIHPVTDESQHRNELAKLIAYSDSDISLLTDNFIPQTTYTLDDLSSTIFRQTDLNRFDLPSATKNVSYRDSIKKYYCPTFAGQSINDAFNLNIRYVSVMCGDVDGVDKLDRPCEIIHDQNFVMDKFERAYLNGNNEDHDKTLRYVVDKIYPGNYGAKILEAIHQCPSVFDEVLKPRIFDAFLKQQSIMLNKFDESYWLMYAQGPLTFSPHKMINKSHNFLVENVPKYKRVVGWLTNVMFSKVDEVKEKRYLETTFDQYDINLIKNYIYFYRYFVFKFASDHISHGHPSLSFAAFPWDVILTQIVNSASSEVDTSMKDIPIRNIDLLLFEAIDKLVKSKKKKEDLDLSQRIVKWQLTGRKLRILY